MIQTDNGTEFTNALFVTKPQYRTLFEAALLERSIAYYCIQIATLCQNGKVERRHQTDELRFYRHMRMYGFEDGRKQLAACQRQFNDHIMMCLGMQSPNQVQAKYVGVMWQSQRVQACCEVKYPSSFGKPCRKTFSHCASFLPPLRSGCICFANLHLPLDCSPWALCNLCLTRLHLCAHKKNA